MWSQVLTMVDTKYQMLIGNFQWEGRSVQSETPQKALKAEIKNEVLQELERMDVKPSGATQPGAVTNITYPNIICNKCKEKGNIARNCPKKDVPNRKEVKNNPRPQIPTRSSPRKESLQSRRSTMSSTLGVSNADIGLLETKHSTGQHRTKSELQGGGTPSSTPAGNLAAGFFGGSLTMTHFHGARHA